MKVLKLILLILATGSVLAMCGKQNRALLNKDVAVNALGDSSGVLSEDDIIDMDATQSVSSLGLSPMGLSGYAVEDGRVLVFLNPIWLKARPGLLRIIRGPLSALEYFYRNPPPACPPVITGNCPGPGNPNGSCTLSFHFTAGCATATTYILGAQVILTFEGELSGSIDASSGMPIINATATNLKVTADDGRYIIYNGSVKREFTEISLSGAKWVLSTSDLEAVDSAGAKGKAVGTRTVEVTYGTYYHAINIGTLTYTPPDGSKTVTIDVDIERTVNRDGLTKVVTIDDTIITNGVTRTLSGTLTWTGEERGQSGELESVTLDGELTRTGPGGSVNIIFNSVEFRLVCDHNPWGGTIQVTNGDKTITFDFREDCGCIVDITLPDGRVIQHNTCEQTEPLNE